MPLKPTHKRNKKVEKYIGTSLPWAMKPSPDTSWAKEFDRKLITAYPDGFCEVVDNHVVIKGKYIFDFIRQVELDAEKKGHEFGYADAIQDIRHGRILVSPLGQVTDVKKEGMQQYEKALRERLPKIKCCDICGQDFKNKLHYEENGVHFCLDKNNESRGQNTAPNINIAATEEDEGRNKTIEQVHQALEDVNTAMGLK